MSRAQYHLGLTYRDGRGVSNSEEEAVKWYRKSAEQGFYPVQSELGLALVEGWGVPKNDVEAYRWFLVAAANGSILAQRRRSDDSSRVTGLRASLNQSSTNRRLRSTSP